MRSSRTGRANALPPAQQRVCISVSMTSTTAGRRRRRPPSRTTTGGEHVRPSAVRSRQPPDRLLRRSVRPSTSPAATNRSDVAHRVVDPAGDEDPRLRAAASAPGSPGSLRRPTCRRRPRPADQPAGHGAGVDAGPHDSSVPCSRVEPLDDRLHLDGEIHCAPDVVDAAARSARSWPGSRCAGCAPSPRPSRSAASSKLSHQVVQQRQRLLRRQLRGEARRSRRCRRRRRRHPGDPGRSSPRPAGSARPPPPASGQQQPSFSALLVEQLLLDRRLRLISLNAAQIAEFVLSSPGPGHVESPALTRCAPARAGGSAGRTSAPEASRPGRPGR